MTNQENPKLFISYSWSNPTHEQWVVDLATELMESGVDVVLDKWDLKEGHDAYAFMEKMVTDPEIKKVLIISDRVYVEKADGRTGGVGTETQIITPEIYDKQDQNKFVVVVTEKDEAGKAYVPTYYKARIHIDLSESEKYAENFEKLLRWVYDEPLYVKPEIGEKPAFLSDEGSISLGTAASFKRTVEAIKNNKPTAAGCLDEYLEIFSENLERFRIEKTEEEFDDAVLKNIEEFLPYRNEFTQLVVTISQYAPNDEYIQKLHRFFEHLIPYMHRPEHIQPHREWDFDNFKFIVHELFLYGVGILLKYERFNQAAFVLGQPYYLPGNSDYGRDVMVSFQVFRNHIKSLKHRNDRLELRRLSLRADLLEQRSKSSGIDFKYLMQADFVIFIRAELGAEDDWQRWWPETLLYAHRFHGPFEIFARAVSKEYFEKMKCILGIQAPKDLENLLNNYREQKRELPRWEFDSFSPSGLLGYEQLAKKP